MQPAFLTNLALAAILAMAAPVVAHSQPVSTSRWVGAWASAQQQPEPHNALPDRALEDATLRQLVRVTIASPAIRVRLSNSFGNAPLEIRGAHVALAENPASPRIRAGTDHALTFGGERSVTIPAGAEYVSDAVALPVPALATVAVSIHFAGHPATQTGHPGSRATSYVAKGDQLSVLDFSEPTKVDHWYQLSGIDAAVPGAKAAAIAILGDSITDGNGVEPNTNQRWPDFLMERLQASARTRHLSVLNLGVGGNRLLKDGLGPNAAARFDRDVLNRGGVRYAIIFEGVNDLGTATRDGPISAADHDRLVEGIITSYRQMIARARERGIKVIGATITPYGGSAYYRPDSADEADRQKINAWIRQPGNFDAVIDFDRLLRDPARPDRLLPRYDKGDGLHPSIAGYRAMGEAVPLSLFDAR